jgi:hypothetical protein
MFIIIISIFVAISWLSERKRESPDSYNELSDDIPLFSSTEMSLELLTLGVVNGARILFSRKRVEFRSRVCPFRTKNNK